MINLAGIGSLRGFFEDAVCFSGELQWVQARLISTGMVLWTSRALGAVYAADEVLESDTQCSSGSMR